MAVRATVALVLFTFCLGAVNEAGAQDLSGVWTNLPRGSGQLRPQSFTGQEPPMNSNDPVFKGFPPGVPRIYSHPMPMEIIQRPDRILMLFEHDSIVRRIWLDGRAPQPSELIPSYMGRSVGRWEGDTLVIETDMFNGRTWIDRVGHPASDALRITERIRRIDRDTLHVDVVLQDPIAYRAPLHDRFVYTAEPAGRIAEHACQDFTSFE